jgi:ABC-type amino acid transport system permease subunit
MTSGLACSEFSRYRPGGALLGMGLRNTLPSHHLSDDSRHLLQIGLGTIGTMAGLVLGLLVASATTSYNAQRSELLDVASKVILLDRVLAHYGPDTNVARRDLRVVVARALTRIWPQESSSGPQLDPLAARGEAVLDDIEDLSPKSDRQRSLKPEAIGLALNLAQIRWLMFEQSGSSISWPLLVLLIFWFTITFIGFGLFAPSNTTTIVALALCSLAVAGAIFVTLEMYTPFQGLVQISSAPLRDALAHLGR